MQKPECRFLLDENINPSLCKLLYRIGLCATSVELLDQGANDYEIIRFALTRDYILITQNYKDFIKYAGALKLIIIHFRPKRRIWQERIFPAFAQFLSKISKL